jgi:hypothetical protein
VKQSSLYLVESHFVNMFKISAVVGTSLLWAPGDARFTLQTSAGYSYGNSGESLSFNKARGAFPLSDVGENQLGVTKYIHTSSGVQVASIPSNVVKPYGGDVNAWDVVLTGDHVTGNMLFVSEAHAINSYDVAYLRGEYSTW